MIFSFGLKPASRCGRTVRSRASVNHLKYASANVRLMSDEMVGDDARYRYAGRDVFPFASEEVADEDTDWQPVEVAMPQSDRPGATDLDEAAAGILRTAEGAHRLRTVDIVTYSVAMNRLCKRLLDIALDRLDTHTGFGNAVPETEGENIAALSVSGWTFPNGRAVSRDNWLRLCSLLVGRLDRFGCVITQRDRKYLSEAADMEISPYIWSTLMRVLDLRRVKNPYSTSSLVIYVPRVKK